MRHSAKPEMNVERNCYSICSLTLYFTILCLHPIHNTTLCVWGAGSYLWSQVKQSSRCMYASLSFCLQQINGVERTLALPDQSRRQHYCNLYPEFMSIIRSCKTVNLDHFIPYIPIVSEIRRVFKGKTVPWP